MDKKTVTILRDAEGKAVGILVETLDERFALELHPIDNGKVYTWPDAMARLKELGKEGFNEKQGKIIAAYNKEINAALEEAGGDELDWEWAVGEYNGYRAWFYFPVSGALDIYYKCNLVDEALNYWKQALEQQQQNRKENGTKPTAEERAAENKLKKKIRLKKWIK